MKENKSCKMVGGLVSLTVISHVLTTLGTHTIWSPFKRLSVRVFAFLQALSAIEASLSREGGGVKKQVGLGRTLVCTEMNHLVTITEVRGCYKLQVPQMEELVCTTTDILRHSESDCPPTITTPCRNKPLSQLRLNFDMAVLKVTTLMRCYSDIFCPSQPFF